MSVPLAEVAWIHGAPDCRANPGPPLQVKAVDEDTYVLRQSKCFSFEAPFMYLLFGNSKAVLFDTGAPPDRDDSHRILPIRDIVERIFAQRAAGAGSALQLLVCHTHGHDDHGFWDGQFLTRPHTTLVRQGTTPVATFFGLSRWPEGQALLDLGGRVLTVLPLPGHHPDHIAVYDSRTQILLTGDTLYPGLLTVRDWAAYRQSATRLAAFAAKNTVSLVLGNHIEMKRTPGELYPLGTTFQPDEHPLPLTPNHLNQWKSACDEIGNSPRREVRDHFIIEPL